jgi:hypothetical protein
MNSRNTVCEPGHILCGATRDRLLFVRLPETVHMALIDLHEYHRWPLGVR